MERIKRLLSLFPVEHLRKEANENLLVTVQVKFGYTKVYFIFTLFVFVSRKDYLPLTLHKVWKISTWRLDMNCSGEAMNSI